MEAVVRREYDEIRAILRAAEKGHAAAQKPAERRERTEPGRGPFATARFRTECAEDVERAAKWKRSDARFEKWMRGCERQLRASARDMARQRLEQRQLDASLRALIADIRKGLVTIPFRTKSTRKSAR